MNRHVELSTNATVAAMASTRDPGALLRRLQGLSKSGACAASLEQAFSELGNEFTSGNVMHFRILVTGKQKTLNRGIREQVFLIGREAVLNALRHSGAANIEIEIEYLRRRTRVFVRDDGCGIDPEIVRAGRDAHWGLRGMRERAENVGAQFHIRSRRGAGTEVEISALNDRPITEGHCAAVIQAT